MYVAEIAGVDETQSLYTEGNLQARMRSDCTPRLSHRSCPNTSCWTSCVSGDRSMRAGRILAPISSQAPSANHWRSICITWDARASCRESSSMSVTECPVISDERGRVAGTQFRGRLQLRVSPHHVVPLGVRGRVRLLRGRLGGQPALLGRMQDAFLL